MQIERNTATTARYVAALGAELEDLAATLAGPPAAAERNAPASPTPRAEPQLLPTSHTSATPKRVA